MTLCQFNQSAVYVHVHENKCDDELQKYKIITHAIPEKSPRYVQRSLLIAESELFESTVRNFLNQDEKNLENMGRIHKKMDFGFCDDVVSFYMFMLCKGLRPCDLHILL